MTPLERLTKIASALVSPSIITACGIDRVMKDRLEDYSVAILEIVDALAPRYTAKVPTEPGDYHWKPSETTNGLLREHLLPWVYRLESIRLSGACPEVPALRHHGGVYSAVQMGGFWSGPILEPAKEVKHA